MMASPVMTDRFDHRVKIEPSERCPEGRIARAAARSNRRRSRLVSMYAILWATEKPITCLPPFRPIGGRSRYKVLGYRPVLTCHTFVWWPGSDTDW